MYVGMGMRMGFVGEERMRKETRRGESERQKRMVRMDCAERGESKR
jgi:hypothetical protein